MSSENTIAARVLTEKNLMVLLVAGVIAEAVLELISWIAFPAILGKPMRPDILVSDLTRSVLGLEMVRWLAITIHLALGFIIFPVIYAFAREAWKFRNWIPASLVYGVVLWAVAQTTLAPLAGRPFMLGFIGYTWGSLINHIIFAVIIGYIVNRHMPLETD